jgi:hypothetical protein
VPAKAYSEGKNGRTLSAVCPAAQIPALRAANSLGIEYYEYTEEINEIGYRLNEIDRLLIAESDPSKRLFLVQEAGSLRAQISLLELQRSLVSSL